MAAALKGSNPEQVFLLQMLHPRRGSNIADVLIAPRHDLLRYRLTPNWIPILGAVSDVQERVLATTPSYLMYPEPRIAVLVGGLVTSWWRFAESVETSRLEAFVDHIANLVGTGTALVTVRDLHPFRLDLCNGWRPSNQTQHSRFHRPSLSQTSRRTPLIVVDYLEQNLAR